jgi:hypothetical protein
LLLALLSSSALLGITPAAAQDTRAPTPADTAKRPGFSFSTGIDYSTGDYGQAEDTEILVVPLSARATVGNLAFTATVPYLRIDGPGGVVIGPGGEPLPGVPGTGGLREGIGDLTLGATYSVPAETLGGLELEFGGRVKLATSDEDKQLSTGQTDFTATTEISYPMGNLIPFVSLGYRFLGDPVGIDLRDGPTASVGTSILLGSSVLITSYDYAQASSPLAEDSHEIFAGFSTPLSSRFNLTAYGIAGLSQGSPDVGVGLLLTTTLF